MAEDKFSRFGIKGMISDIDTIIDEKAESLIREMEIPQSVHQMLQDGKMEVRIVFPEEVRNKAAKDTYYGNGTWQQVFKRFTALLKEEGLLIYFSFEGRGGCCRTPKKIANCGRCNRSISSGYQPCDSPTSPFMTANYCRPSNRCESCKSIFSANEQKVYQSILIKVRKLNSERNTSDFNKA